MPQATLKTSQRETEQHEDRTGGSPLHAREHARWRDGCEANAKQLTEGLEQGQTVVGGMVLRSRQSKFSGKRMRGAINKEKADNIARNNAALQEFDHQCAHGADEGTTPLNPPKV